MSCAECRNRVRSRRGPSLPGRAGRATLLFRNATGRAPPIQGAGRRGSASQCAGIRGSAGRVRTGVGETPLVGPQDRAEEGEGREEGEDPRAEVAGPPDHDGADRGADQRERAQSRACWCSCRRMSGSRSIGLRLLCAEHPSVAVVPVGRWSAGPARWDAPDCAGPRLHHRQRRALRPAGQSRARPCVAGHEVRVAAPASYAAAVRRTGLIHVPFDDPPAELIGPVMARLARGVVRGGQRDGAATGVRGDRRPRRGAGADRGDGRVASGCAGPRAGRVRLAGRGRAGRGAARAGRRSG